METENMEKMNGIEEFATEFCEFRKKMSERTNGSAVSNDEIITLYAIFRKDARTDRMNGNGNGYGKPKYNPNALATEKQKGLLSSLIKKGKVKDVNLDILTKRDASKLLDDAFGKGR